MHLDLQRLAQLRNQPPRPAAAGELRRVDQVFLVASELPLRPTLETIFESDCQKPADLFWLRFATAEEFLLGEELVRQLKKNFRGYLLGRFEFLPPADLIDRAYASGLDLLELPLTEVESPQWAALDYARTVFPQWSVLATLSALAQNEALAETLAQAGIVPLFSLEGVPAKLPQNTLAASFKQLQRSWRRHKVALKPLRPLLELTTPLTPPPQPRGVGALLDRVDDARLRTTSDLRRLLRVREVADSFESAGL